MFNYVFPIQFAKDCLKEMQTDIEMSERRSKESSRLQSSAQSQEDRSENSSARKGSREYQTQKTESLVYVLYSCKVNICSYNWQSPKNQVRKIQNPLITVALPSRHTTFGVTCGWIFL
jgi:alanyl-tRNA synthetase